MITGSNVTIMVKSMDASIRFYEQIGLTLQQRWGDHYAMLTTEGVTIGLHPGDGEVHSSGSVSVGFMVNAIADVKLLLDGKEIRYYEEDGKSGHYLHLTDPDNTQLYFVEPRWER